MPGTNAMNAKRTRAGQGQACSRARGLKASVKTCPDPSPPRARGCPVPGREGTDKGDGYPMTDLQPGGMRYRHMSQEGMPSGTPVPLRGIACPGRRLRQGVLWPPDRPGAGPRTAGYRSDGRAGGCPHRLRRGQGIAALQAPSICLRPIDAHRHGARGQRHCRYPGRQRRLPRPDTVPLPTGPAKGPQANLPKTAQGMAPARPASPKGDSGL